MNAYLVERAAHVIVRAQVLGKHDAVPLAMALESAQMLQFPETAAEVERLRHRVAELEADSRRLSAILRLAEGKPGYHTITVKRLLTAEDTEAGHLAPCRGPGSPDCTCAQMDPDELTPEETGERENALLYWLGPRTDSQQADGGEDR